MASDRVSSTASPILGIIVVIIVLIIRYKLIKGLYVFFSPPAPNGLLAGLISFFLGWDFVGFWQFYFNMW